MHSAHLSLVCTWKSKFSQHLMPRSSMLVRQSKLDCPSAAGGILSIRTVRRSGNSEVVLGFSWQTDQGRARTNGSTTNFLDDAPGPGADFLNWLCQADQQLLGMMPAAWVSAACDAVIGDNYPAPVRCLSVCEQPLKAYMIRELFDDRQVPLDVFQWKAERQAFATCSIP